MGFRIDGHSSSRNSNIGGLVEAFIDANRDDFSINQLDLLEQLAEEVDNAAKEFETQVQDLQNELEETA